MKSNSRLFSVLAVGLALTWWGCDSKTVPVGTYSAPASIVDRTTVANFNSGSASINPTLFEANAPGNVLTFPGVVLTVNNFSSYVSATGAIQSPGANSTAMAYHVTGIVNDLGNSIYPAIDLEAPMDYGNKYDMSFFTGVRFYFKTELDDTALKRIFQIPLYQTQGTPAGKCDPLSNKCYDHFTTTLTGTNGIWQQYSIKFTDMTRQGFGFTVAPTDLSGYNLTQVLWLLWEESNNNTNVSSTIDFWVDEIQFF